MGVKTSARITCASRTNMFAAVAVQVPSLKELIEIECCKFFISRALLQPPVTERLRAGCRYWSLRCSGYGVGLAPNRNSVCLTWPPS
jgi:hypothetical protein